MLLICSKTVKRPTTSLGPTQTEQSDDEEDLTEHEGKFYENLEIAEEDEKALELFMAKDAPARRTLGDIIMEKLTEKQTEVASQMTESGQIMPDLDERVIQVYKGVGQILTRYRSGKLPKAFKILPSLRLWEQVSLKPQYIYQCRVVAERIRLNIWCF